MAFLKSLFGKSGDAQEQEKKARETLESLSEGLPQNPQSLLKQLEKIGRQFYECFGLGKSLHDDYRQALIEVEKRLPASELSPYPFPTVEVIPWETWQYPTLGNLVEQAEKAVPEILYLTAPLKRSHRNTLAELDALRLFSKDPRIGMVVIGEEDMMFRREFLHEAGQRISPDTEDIGQDLADFASSNDWESRFL